MILSFHDYTYFTAFLIIWQFLWNYDKVLQVMDNKTNKLLERNVEQVLPSKEELAELMEKRKIKLYYGIDPTSPNLHLGHAVQLRKLAKFQELGHEVILLFGTFTAQIGDPSGHNSKRETLSKKEVDENLKTYKKQASKILDVSKATIKRNEEWLAEMDLEKMLKLASHFTTSQLLKRDLFQRRLKNNKEIWLHELFYPIMQGYDSVAMDIDLELGATDQTFNMLIGRDLQKEYNNKEKFVLTTPMLTGLDGRGMSKSRGNTVNLTDSPQDMFGKLMSLNDKLIPEYFKLCTNESLEKIEEVKNKLEQGNINPKSLKVELAKKIVTLYHSKEEAEEAEEEFNKVFKEKKYPSDMPEFSIDSFQKDTMEIDELLVKLELASSKTEAKNLIDQGGIKIDGEEQNNWNKEIKIEKGKVIQRGKKTFVKLV
ncbi:MAG: tyrosine--tRNA ligase [Candidatus Paceibacterota bacterium]